MSYLGLAPKGNEPHGSAASQIGPGVLQNSENDEAKKNSANDEAKKVAAAALAAVKEDAATSSAGRGKVVVSMLLSNAPNFCDNLAKVLNSLRN